MSDMATKWLEKILSSFAEAPPPTHGKVGGWLGDDHSRILTLFSAGLSCGFNRFRGGSANTGYSAFLAVFRVFRGWEISVQALGTLANR